MTKNSSTIANLKLNYAEAAKRELFESPAELDNNFNLLVILSDIYREFGDHEKSLKYAKLLVDNHSKKWEGYGLLAVNLAKLEQPRKAENYINLGLKKLPNNFNILVIGSDVFHSYGEYEKSLLCAKSLISHYSDVEIGFVRAVTDLVALKRHKEAQEILAEGLNKFPGHFKLLILSTNIYTSIGDYENALQHAELLISCYPNAWEGYNFAARSLASLKQLEEASNMIEEGLKKIPNQAQLFSLAIEVYSLLGNYEKALSYARLLICHHPCMWQGHGEASKILAGLRKQNEAQEQIELALQIFPNQFNLLVIACEVYSSFGSHETSLRYADLLIEHHSDKKEGYAIATKEMMILQMFEKAIFMAEKGISKFKDNEYFYAILSDFAFAKGNTKMYERYENALQKKLLSVDAREKLNVTAADTKSKLKAEYSSPIDKPKSDGTSHPDLYIIAGFSGCGKTTFLNTAFYSVEKIYSPCNHRIKTLPVEFINYLNKRRTLTDAKLQAIFFCNAFGLNDAMNQQILPQQTLVHLDLTGLLLRGHLLMPELTRLEIEDLKSVNMVEDFFKSFFTMPFFKKFNTISIATFHQELCVNAERYMKRNGTSFHFDSSTESVYKQILKSWHHQISSLPRVADYTIKETKDYYEITKK
ncbi:lipopolysaccharide assembly protein LapB [Synechococcus sp. N19]|uniref:tetratricopeptide repeat protein n=1 Tax=Synechococcus sp. N19 TaxID=2575512 RepID=UPI0010BE4D13|nr:hypothetical protein [Synechococcus sp. N19]